MVLPELNQPITKDTEVRATPARLRPTVTEGETCFRTPSWKKKFEEQPNRKAAENTVPPKVKGGQEENFSSIGKWWQREDSWKKRRPATGRMQQHYVQISCTICLQNCLKHLDSRGRNSLKPLKYECLWTDFRETHARSTTFLKKNIELHKNPINGSVADTRSQTDKRTWSPDNAVWFYFVNNA